MTLSPVMKQLTISIPLPVLQEWCAGPTLCLVGQHRQHDELQPMSTHLYDSCDKKRAYSLTGEISCLHS